MVSRPFFMADTVSFNCAISSACQRSASGNGLPSVRFWRTVSLNNAGCCNTVATFSRTTFSPICVPVTQIGLNVVRENVATVLQHPALFNDTVRQNLTLGRPLPDADLWQALEIAQLKETVSAMKNGLDTMVGRQGVRLSGGQRQRIAIARMILSEPKVVILDEATSALDAATEYQLQ